MPYLVILGIALVVLFFVAWLVVMIGSYLLMVAFAVSGALVFAAIAVGLAIGAVLPALTILGFYGNEPEKASALRVKNGEVLRRQPSGPSAHMGWDSGWANYVPYQLNYDIAAGQAHTLGLARLVWKKGTKPLRALFRYLNRGGVFATVINFLFKAFVAVLVSLVWTLPLLALWVSVAGGFYLMFGVAKVCGYLVTVGQRMTTSVMRSKERTYLEKTGAGLACIYCFQTTNSPAYRCPCGEVHYDIHPGALGIRSRTCICENVIPLTVRLASQDPRLTCICPSCNKEQPHGSGARTTIPVVVFGTVAAGKTQFLARAITDIATQANNIGAELRPLTPHAEDFLKASESEAQSNTPVRKTDKDARPEGRPYSVRINDAEQEYRFIDVAGEQFINEETSRELSYFDMTDAFVFIYDPLQLPDCEAARVAVDPAAVSNADPAQAYGSVVDRLRNTGIDVGKKRLAFAVSKCDLISAHTDIPLPENSDSVRQWLLDHDADDLVRRAELDFAEVRYFAVDSFTSQNNNYPSRPLSIIDWLAAGSTGQMLGMAVEKAAS